MFAKYILKHRRTKKVICSILTVTFFSFFILTDSKAVIESEEFDVGIADQGLPAFANLGVETFTLPSHLGEVKYSSTGDPGRIIIHIQDAHANHYAQSKIASIIEYLSNEYGVKMVNLEGGVGEYDLSIFTNITGGAIRREVADYFLKKGEINGAEFFAANNPGRIELWGIEDRNLYLANLKVYRDSLKYKDEVDKYLKELSHIIDNLKRHIYDAELLKIDMNYGAYKTKSIEFREYLEFLIEAAGSHGIKIEDFPNIHLLEQSMEKEALVDFKKANDERNMLIDELKAKSSRATIRDIVAKTLDFKTRKISSKAFYNYLFDLAESSRIDIKKFPTLGNYIDYVSTFEAVDRFKLIEEMDDLESVIKEDVFTSQEQRTLSLLSKNLILLNNIFDIRLNRTDYQYYLDNKGSFDAQNFISFIQKEAPKHRIMARPSESIFRLDIYRDDLAKFFDFSFMRDEVFLKNMKYSRIPGGMEAAILMTGGFHTENLCRLFEEKGVSYVSVMPKFKSAKGYESPYFQLLAGETTSLQSILGSVIAQASMLQVASHLSKGLAEEVWGRTGTDAFKVAVMMRELVARGYNIGLKYADAEGEYFVDINEAFGLMPKKDDPSITLTAEDVIEFVHQEQVDASIEAAAGRENVGDVHINVAITRLQDLQNQLGDQAGEFDRVIGMLENLRDGVWVEEGVTKGIFLITEGEMPILFGEHPGGKGIQINKATVLNKDGTINEERIVRHIIHGAVGNFTYDDALSRLVEHIAMGESNEYVQLAEKLRETPLREKSLAESTPEEREALAGRRDLFKSFEDQLETAERLSKEAVADKIPGIDIATRLTRDQLKDLRDTGVAKPVDVEEERIEAVIDRANELIVRMGQKLEVALNEGFPEYSSAEVIERLQKVGIDEAMARDLVERLQNPGYQIKEVKIYEVDLGYVATAQSFVEEDTLVVFLNNNPIRPLSEGYLEKDIILVNALRAEQLEASENFRLEHAMVKHLEMIDNDYDALTELNRFFGDLVMTGPELENLEPEHVSDPGNKFYNFVQQKLEIAQERDFKDHVPRNLPPTALVVGLPADQYDLEISTHKGIATKASGILMREIGVNVKVFFFREGDTESRAEASAEAKNWEAFREAQENNLNPRLVIIDDETMTPEEAANYVKDPDVAAVIRHEKLEPGQWLEHDLLMELGVILAELDRVGDVPSLVRMALDYFGLLSGDMEKFEQLGWQDLKRFMSGIEVFKIKKIDYEELREFRKARLAVLRAL